MPKVVIKKCPEFFLKESMPEEIYFGLEDYSIRLGMLTERLKETGKTHAVFFGDREHFANIHYFCGMDCRFEEALFVVTAEGEYHIVVGNEGVSQTYPIPFPVTVHFYQNFSLQLQPRDQIKPLQDIFRAMGMGAGSQVGLVGYKYFTEMDKVENPAHTYDVPAYVLDALFEVCPPQQVENYAEEIIGFPRGIRTRLHTAKDIAWAEAAGNISAGVVLRMLKKLRPGISELETTFGVADLRPTSVHTMVNFGPEKVRVGVASPSARRLQLGEVCGVCYGTRGSLTSRVGVAAWDKDTVAEQLQPHLGIYEELWHTLAEILVYYRVGASCAEIHEIAMGRLGAPEYNVVLNATHYTGAEEWLNAPVYKNSPYTIHDGSHIQIDLIASNPDPVRTAICEDSMVIAGPELRGALAREYPQVYARITARQQMMREALGIYISDDVLPMSNLTSVYFPYMLNLGCIFALED